MREQWGILAVDERAAIRALPQLLPADAATRHAFADQLQEIVAATVKLNADGQRRLKEVLQLLAADGVLRRSAPRNKGQSARR